VRGPQLYSGSEDAPTFITDSWTRLLTDNGLPATITITDITSATPEPSSIALLGTGFLGFAGIVGRRFVA
jgi:hypothetical protein